MGDPITVRFDQPQKEAIKELAEQGKAANKSEAHRMVVNAGLRYYGYNVAMNGNTRLKRTAGTFARFFTWVGVAWLVFTWAYPVELRLIGVVIMFMAAALWAIYVALGRFEPRVSKVMGKLVNRGDVA